MVLKITFCLNLIKLLSCIQEVFTFVLQFMSVLKWQSIISSLHSTEYYIHSLYLMVFSIKIET